MAEDTAELLERWKAGDQTAAAELFERYASRLVALTRSRLSPQLVQRFDPEDVVQSAYRSFFVAARAGHFDLQHGTELWQLLVSITLHKLHHQVRHNSARKRDVERELSLDEQSAPLAREPSPVEAIALTDQVEQLMRSLQPVERHILQLRLQGYQLDEIAEHAQRGERTVRRILERIKGLLEQWQNLDISVEPTGTESHD